MPDMDDPEFEWLSPSCYPSRVDDAMAKRIALAVRHGASVGAACMREGVSPSTWRRWLHWGEAAYRRDANDGDFQDQYLNLFLKVMQALGIVGVEAQQRIYQLNPTWWLTHNPDIRADWVTQATAVAGQNLIEAEVAKEATSEITQLPTPSPDTLRAALSTLIEGGALLPTYRSTIDNDDSESNVG